MADYDTTFRFIGCSEIQELLGKQADDERALAELLEEVPLDSVYFHTHSYFLRQRFIERTYPNDFAEWVGEQVRDHVLEALAVMPGTHTINLTCRGKNPDSQGYFLGVDSVRLRERWDRKRPALKP